MSGTALAASRSPEQRMEALDRANKVRRLRAMAKRDMTVAAAVGLIESPPWWMGTMRAEALVRALPGHGPVRTAWVLRVCGISTRKTLDGLSARQRLVLCDAISGRNGFVPKGTA